MAEQRQNTGPRAKTAGFTLVELLVVISIMSMLMSILMPTLSSAREQSWRIECSSNMRQLTIAWFMYASENDDRLCSADTGWNDLGANHWVADGPAIPGNPTGGTEEAIENGVLWEHTAQTLKLYKCRSDRSELLRSYAISRTMNGCNYEDDNIEPFRIYHAISRAGEKMVFVDAASKWEFIEGSFCPIEDINAYPPTWFRRLSRNITARHSGGCNVSFADLHCEYRKYRDQRTVDFADWRINSEDASLDNPDLEWIMPTLKGL